MNSTLQPLAEEHRQSVIDIYNHYVDHGFASYREIRIPYEAFDRFLAMSKGFPAYVSISEEGQVEGFAFLHAWHPSECFTRIAEVTYFLHPDATRKGIGSRLLKRMIEEAAVMKVDRILASISSRNPESLAFHRKYGFEECGRFSGIGTKHGQDFDVVWMMKRL